MKGLPLAYSKDMQEDKEQVFDAADSLMLALAAMEGMARDIAPNAPALRAAAASGFSTATDLADWLVRALGLPFREAHHVTGTLVRMAEERGVDLTDLGIEEMRGVHPGTSPEVYQVFGVDNSVRLVQVMAARRPIRCARRFAAGASASDDGPPGDRLDRPMPRAAGAGWLREEGRSGPPSPTRKRRRCEAAAAGRGAGISSPHPKGLPCITRHDP